MHLHAQPFGNEWIKTYQPYYKIKILNTGVYRISSMLLQTTGINFSTIHPKRFQVFKNGIEQPLFIWGSEDQLFDNTDYIEFFAEPNDGALDTELYNNPIDQPHPWQSFFSDTGVYFLTILPDTTVVNAMRLVNTAENNFSAYTAEPYFIHESRFFRADEYVEGINLNPNSEKYNTSEYSDGEGWGAQRIGLGQSAIYSVATPFFNVSGPAPSLELKMAGVSDFYLTSPTFNHHVITAIAPAENPIYTTIDDRKYKGYITQKFNTSLPTTSIGSSMTNIRLQVVNDLLVSSDFNSLLYYKLSYPRNYQLANQTEFKLAVNHIQPGIRSYLLFQQFGNGSKSNPLLFDFKSRKRVRGIFNLGNAQFLIDKQSNSSDVYVFDSTDVRLVTSMNPVNFNVPPIAQQIEYIIVSSTQLSQAATEFELYRSQRYRVWKVMADELYDYYTYGNVHPLAIRRMSAHLYKTQTNKPSYLLLLGKGYQNNLLRNAITFGKNLVPAIGVPASDHLFTSSLVGNGFEPQIAIGRIPASNNQQAINYLDKLKYYENPTDSLMTWRKNILHISGGNNANEQVIFKSQMNSYGQVIQGKSFGANLYTYNKSTNEPVQNTLRDELQNILNNGVSVMSFLGHGSANVLDVSFGSLAETNNPNRYPLFYFNGCNIGNPSDFDPTTATDIYGPDYVCAANKGAIAWLAHSNLTLDGKLYGQMNSFYQRMSSDHYGRNLGDIIQATCASLTSSDPQMRSHCQQLTLQGDPAVRIHSPTLPDYTITPADVFFNPSNPNASLDSFAMGVIVTNRGRAIDDTVTVNVTRVLPGGSRVVATQTYITSLYFKDTVFIWLKNPSSSAAVGNNLFEIEIDKSNRIVEGNKSNNSISLQRFIPGIGVTALMPYKYAIVSIDTVSLVAQNNNLYSKDIEYVFEMDTSFKFNSPLKQTQIVTRGALAFWKVKLMSTDTTVYFWRVKLSNVQGAQDIWSVSSFTHIPNGNKGWNQRHFRQYSAAESVTDLIFDTIQNRMQFSADSRNVKSAIARWRHAGLGIQDEYFATPEAFKCIASGGIIAKVYDKATLKEKSVNGFPVNCVNDPIYPYYAIDTKTPTGQQQFITLVDSMKQGDYISLLSYYHVGAENWTQAMRDAFVKIGSLKTAAASGFYTAFVLIGKKGEAAGQAYEDTIYSDQYNSPNPNDIAIEVTRAIKSNWHTGLLQSQNIGPSEGWGKVYYHFYSTEDAGTDRNYVSLYAQDTTRNDTLIMSNVSSGTDISWLDAKRFPYIKLAVKLVDSTFRTPNQFGNWMVTYQSSPEGTFDLDLANDFHAETIEQGDSISFKYAFTNISDTDFDSLDLHVNVMDEKRELRYAYNNKIQPLKSGESVMIQKKISSNGMRGNCMLNTSINGQREQPELSLVNNYLVKGFHVKYDDANPLLDVTFDGYRILNGDYVSPKPLIAITSKDDNSFQLQSDTSTFSISLKRPNQSQFEVISHTHSAITFYPATDKNNQARLEYKPEKLPNGLYTLRVQSRDANGNISGKNAFEIEFRVEDKSTITHFFPYPNPGTTNIRFVFTLTGSAPPDQLLIRIMTISGITVREIRRDEFGAIKIGQNISEFAWDGTDKFGDRLANGVYLYQVFTKLDGKNIDKRTTESDSYFMHDTGKIYLLR